MSTLNTDLRDFSFHMFRPALKKILFPVDGPTGYLFQGHSGGFFFFFVVEKFEKKEEGNQ